MGGDANRGTLSGSAMSATAGVESWGLSQTGNWLGHDLDLEGDGTNEINATNTFTLANEWEDRDTNSSAPAEHTLVYDAVGNLTSDDDAYDYKYDAYGQLRYVYETGTTDIVAEYRYNGLNQRITAHYDTDVDGDVDGSDVVSHFVYDQRWRTVARYEDANTDPTEQWVHHHAGLAESGSGSYIDSVILRDRDTTGNGTLDERLYYLQNWRSDVVALITDTGDQREHVRYEPYGTPFGLPAGDIDSDGDFDATDYAGITGSYDVRKDVNMDGSITFADTTAAYNINGLQTLGRGVASSDAVLNRKGYAGYEHLSELAGAKWDVRNRILISELGTWNRRDPLGYVYGMSLYTYVSAMPIVAVDSMGLQVVDPTLPPDSILLDNSLGCRTCRRTVAVLNTVGCGGGAWAICAAMGLAGGWPALLCALVVGAACAMFDLPVDPNMACVLMGYCNWPIEGPSSKLPPPPPPNPSPWQTSEITVVPGDCLRSDDGTNAPQIYLQWLIDKWKSLMDQNRASCSNDGFMQEGMAMCDMLYPEGSSCRSNCYAQIGHWAGYLTRRCKWYDRHSGPKVAPDIIWAAKMSSTFRAGGSSAQR